jgi:hypothetical protein
VSILERLAFFQGRRDEVPNQDLARHLAATGNKRDIEEIVENLSHSNPRVRADCLKVLYELGYIRPELIADHVRSFLTLLPERNNRLVWGAMIALSTIAGLQSAAIGRHADQIMKIMKTGSVITVDNGVETLSIVASKEAGLREKLLSSLFDHLESCRPKDVPQHAEKTLVAVDSRNMARFARILNGRLPELTPSQAKRVRKVLQSAGSS